MNGPTLSYPERNSPEISPAVARLPLRVSSALPLAWKSAPARPSGGRYAADPLRRRHGHTGCIAPEQAEGDTASAGPASDVYSLGVILYEMLTGQLPFQGGSVGKLMAQILTETPLAPGRLRPGLSPALGAVCLKAMARDPASRYPGMSDLAADLQRFLDSASRPPSKDRRRLAAAAGGLALLAAVALGAVLWIKGKEETGGGEVSGATANAEPGRIRALVIGVNRYDRKEVLGELKYAEADAIEMSAVLRSIASKPEDVTLLATQLEKPHLAPRKHHTLRELQGMVRVSKPADTPIVSFAGREVLRRGDGEYYLGLSDADPDDPKAMLTLTEVYAELSRARAALRLVLIDACRMPPEGDPTEAKVQPPEAVTVFVGCSAREVAFEDPDHRHGIFSCHVIEGLKGSADLDRDGKVTLAELEKFVKESVPEHMRRRHKQSQNPELLGSPKEERLLLVARMKSAE